MESRTTYIQAGYDADDTDPISQPAGPGAQRPTILTATGTPPFLPPHSSFYAAAPPSAGAFRPAPGGKRPHVKRWKPECATGPRSSRGISPRSFASAIAVKVSRTADK